MGSSVGSGRYQVDESIGQGPHGVVYTGTDGAGNRLAFKTLREALSGDPDLVTRYLQVEHALRGSAHPNLVEVLELIAEHGTVTLVTDLVAGSSLRKQIAANDPMLPAEVARVGAGIASGLAQLHRSGIVHGDVKPENVVLDESASTKIPLITDCVLARMLGMPHGGHGTPSLTDPRYTAPELAGGNVATPASDLYSLGIMLYEMCCGVPPFVGPTPYSVLRQHVEFEPGRPEGIPDPLWEVVWLLLLKNPQERHQNANEIAVVLSGMVGELMSAMCALRLTTPPSGRRLTGPPPGSDPGPGPAMGPPISDDRPTTIMAPLGGSVATGNKKRKVLTATALSVVVLAGLIVFLSTRSGGQSTASGPAPGPNFAATATPQQAQPQVTAAPSSAAPTVAPNLIGDSVAQAQDLLPSIQLVMTKTVDTKHASDTVIAQNPAAGQPLSGTMQLTIAEAPEVVYLDSLQVANGDWSQTDTNASLGGQTLVHSLISGFGFCDESNNTTTIEYDIAKGYRKLIATAGIDDQSPDSDAEVNLQIFGDNQPLSNTAITYGKPVKLDIDVSGVLRLKLQYQPVIKGQCENSDNFDLGDAQLQGLPGEVPASVDPDSSIDSVEPGN